jgi:hypothetical protein
MSEIPVRVMVSYGIQVHTDGDSFGGAVEPTMYPSLPSALEFE